MCMRTARKVGKEISSAKEREDKLNPLMEIALKIAVKLEVMSFIKFSSTTNALI